MNSRIPSRSLRIEILVALGTRSAALLAKKLAVADLAPKLADANDRLVRADTVRKQAGVARFNASQDRVLADEAVQTVVRLAQCAVLRQSEGCHGHPTYRAAFPKGQTPLVKGATAKRHAALSDLASLLKADPAHVELATRCNEAIAAWKAAVDAHAVARGAEARSVLQSDQARDEWVMDYATARAEALVRLRNSKAVKALFPYTLRKPADDGTDAETPTADVPGVKPEAGATAAKPADAAPAKAPEVPAKGNGTPEPVAATPVPGGSAPPTQDLGVA